MVPALAVAESLRALGADVVFIGGARAEAELVPAAGYPLHTLVVRGLPRRDPLGALRALGAAALAFLRARALLRSLRPDAVMGAGGYVSGPVGLAAVTLRIPLVLTEADSHLGLANRALAPFAWRVCLAFPPNDVGGGGGEAHRGWLARAVRDWPGRAGRARAVGRGARAVGRGARAVGRGARAVGRGARAVGLGARAVGRGTGGGKSGRGVERSKSGSRYKVTGRPIFPPGAIRGRARARARIGPRGTGVGTGVGLGAGPGGATGAGPGGATGAGPGGATGAGPGGATGAGPGGATGPGPGEATSVGPAGATGAGPPQTRVLVFGGSLGARSINLAALDAYAGADFHVLHVCGRRDHPELSARPLAPNYDLRAYLDLPDFADALAVADLVVARAGGSIFEIAAAGRPAILVPYPHATADHQTANAAWMARAGAALVIPDSELDGPRLARETAALLDDPARLHTMASASAALGRPDAAREVAAELLQAAGAGDVGGRAWLEGAGARDVGAEGAGARKGAGAEDAGARKGAGARDAGARKGAGATDVGAEGAGAEGTPGQAAG